MSFQYVRKIPTFQEILKEMPLPADLKKVKAERDAEIRAVFERRSDKFLLVIGPCSADNENAVCEYVARLARVQDKVKDQLILIPRIYTNKPRTTGKGYQGMIHQPVPTEEPDIVAGIKAIRKMHLRALKESHLTPADEMLYPANYPYLEDLLSYVAVGARSVENQQHRLTASGLDIPVGMKNPTSGDLTVMLNSIEAAQHAHTFVYHDWEVRTPGNPLTHAVLRGATAEAGKNIPNYSCADLTKIAQVYLKRSLKNPAVIVDTNHANSAKDFRRQPAIAMDVLSSLRKDAKLKDMVRGLMIESYLVEGTQDASGGVYGKSITDACLGWEDSEKLILNIAESVAKL